MAKATHGYNRTHRVAFRLSEKERRRAEARRLRSGAETLSAYAREAMLHGMEFEVPAWKHLRALINALNENTYEVRRAGWSKKLEVKADAAYDAISRIGT